MMFSVGMFVIMVIDYYSISNTVAATKTVEMNDDNNNMEQCSLYLAPSSIPGAGLGIYAGVDVLQDELVTSMIGGEICLSPFSSEEIVSMISEYAWDTEYIGMEYEVPFDTNRVDEHAEKYNSSTPQPKVNIMSSVCPGLGMLLNDFSGFHNVELTFPTFSLDTFNNKKVPLSRNNFMSPLAGSFSYYSNLHTKATKDIPAGRELYVSYGEDYFQYRPDLQRIVPTYKDIQTAKLISHNLQSFYLKHIITKNDEKGMEKILHWFSQKAMPEAFPNNKPVSNLLPQTIKDLEGQYGGARIPDPLKSVRWLEKTGYCLDKIEARQNNKGKGAYASSRLTKNISKGSIVAPVSLLQLERSKFHSYHITTPHTSTINDQQKSTSQNITESATEVDENLSSRKMLLLNYCYSHPESSLMLLPYSPVVNFINHDLKNYNVRLQWVNGRSNDAISASLPSDWLQLSVQELLQKTKAGLLMELVATRDIEPGEEILLNYGEDWQNAWEKHVREWQPPSNDENYNTAFNMTEQTHPILDTKYEQNERRQYPKNVITACFVDWRRKYAFYEEALSEDAHENDGDDSDNDIKSDSTNTVFTHQWKEKYEIYERHYLRPCDILERHEGENEGTFFYTVQIYNGPIQSTPNGDDKSVKFSKLESGEQLIVTDMPRKAIEFVDTPYSTDQHLPNTFRHTISIPDEIFPSAWKDRKKNHKKVFESKHHGSNDEL